MNRFLGAKIYLLLILLCPLLLSANTSNPSSTFSDKETSELITIICTTNPIPTIPSAKILYDSMKSLYQIPALRHCKKIIIFDGIQPGYEHRSDDYDQYIENVERLRENSKYFNNTKLHICGSWVHLAGAIGEAIELVDTPYVFIHQHDFVLTKKFDLNGLIESMNQNPNIKHVRLNAYRKNLPSKKHGQHYSYDGDVDEFTEGGLLVHLSRTFGWSDNDHISPTSYYREFVLPQCEFGAMEWYMNPMLKNAIEQDGLEGHRPFGTYLYGGLGDGGYLFHLDGREMGL